MIIIPARLASTRFRRKIMCDIGGVPMFIKSALNASSVDEVVLAVDSDECAEIAARHKIKAIVTNPNLPNGSLRCLEAARVLGLRGDSVIINLQADEPFLESSVIKALLEAMKNAEFMATCAKEISESEAQSPNIVKVLLDFQNNAIYFSRSKIPYYRDSKGDEMRYLGHLGLYGYFKDSLEMLANLPETQLENIEKLEQLRAIYYGKKIKVALVESNSIGIDTLEDYNRAKEVYRF